MPPKKPQSAKGKNKPSKDDSEDFQHLLSELQKVTKAVGKEHAKERDREESLRKQNLQKHEALAKKSATNDVVAYLERRQQQQKMQELFRQLMAANRPFLTSPKTDFTGESIASPCGKFDIGVGAMQGWRSNMEDAHVVDLSLGAGVGLFAVFDGHAGDMCAKQSKILVPALVRKHMKDEASVAVDFNAAYLELDQALRGKLQDDSGCTACTVLITPTTVVCSNVGDSRAVLCRGEVAIDLSEDHKPESPEERVRIEAAGGHVENNRVNGQLAMSRAIGDYSYKQQADRKVDEQLVIPVPDVVSKERVPEDRFVVLACDGIFDVLSNQELVSIISEELKKGEKPEKICEKVCNICLAPPAPEGGQPSRSAGTDNMTIVIVKLQP